jgi:hypothetical protein
LAVPESFASSDGDADGGVRKVTAVSNTVAELVEATCVDLASLRQAQGPRWSRQSALAVPESFASSDGMRVVRQEGRGGLEHGR